MAGTTGLEPADSSGGIFPRLRRELVLILGHHEWTIKNTSSMDNHQGIS
jgi:hypothetical protein